MSMNRGPSLSLAVTLVLAFGFLAPHMASAQCATSDRGATNSVAFIWIQAQNWPGGNTSSVTSAAQAWNTTCGGTGSQNIPEFWTSPSQPPGSFSVLNVVWNSGLSPVFDRCGDFVGITINIYEFTRQASNNQVIACNTFNTYTELVAHELGHRLGLGHPPTTNACRGEIMATINGSSHAISASECQKADDLNATPPEVNNGCINPFDCHQSPILIKLDRRPWRLTSMADGVLFDFDGDGVPSRTGWTAPGSEIAFLFRDLNGNGCVDSGIELFGDSMIAEGIGTYVNGFEALVAFDEDKDGWVTLNDARWDELELWVDENHDGRCLPSETRTLESAGIVAIEHAYRRIGRKDVHGNEFRLMARALTLDEGGALTAMKIYDVYFLTSPTE